MSDDKVLKYQELVLNNVNFQYGKAQKAYNKKRRAFARQLNDTLQKDLGITSNKIAQEYTDSILRVLMGQDGGGADMSDTQLEKARTAMEDIAKKAIDQAQTDNKNAPMANAIKNMMKQVAEDMSDWEEKQAAEGKEGYSKPAQAFIGRLTTKLKAQYPQFLKNYDQGIEQLKSQGNNALQAKILASYGLRTYLRTLFGIDGVAKSGQEEIDNKAINHFLPLGKDTYLSTLKGYYRETAVADAYSKGFSKIAEKLDNSMFKKYPDLKLIFNIGGKNTVADINLDALLHLSDIEQVIKSTTAQGRAEVETDVLNEKIYALFENSATTFGAQVKSWQLGQYDGRPLSIGNRSGLLSAFERANSKYPNQSQAASIAFMGLEQNIMEALGPENVIFIDGKNYYWMDQFISSFRQKQYYLTFDYKLDKESQQRMPSKEVILYQWYMYNRA